MDAIPQPAEKFCPQCGKSCLPLTVPHISADCSDCGRTVHFVRPGDNGVGIKVEKGDRFTIPAGWIQMSLEPRPGTEMSRSGMTFLLKQYFVGNPPTEESFREFVEKLQDEFDAVLEKSDKAKGLDLSTEDGGKMLVERCMQEEMSRDRSICAATLFCGGVQWSIENNNPERAAWAGYMLGSFRGLSIVTEPVFEQTLWRGYLSNKVVYDAAAAASKTPAEAEAIKKLEPLFQRLDEAALHAWVESGVDLGSRIGVRELPEEVLKNLAKFHLATMQQARQEAAWPSAAIATPMWFIRRMPVSSWVALFGALVVALGFGFALGKSTKFAALWDDLTGHASSAPAPAPAPAPVPSQPNHAMPVAPRPAVQNPVAVPGPTASSATATLSPSAAPSPAASGKRP